MSTGKFNLSVVIPTFNNESTIKRCLESVKWASEIIIVDMGSTDRTTLIAKKYGTRILVKKNPKDGNFDWNRLFGMRKAKSEWILKLDSDEELTKDLQKELRYLVTHDYDKNINGFWLRNKIYFARKQIRYGPVDGDSKELRIFRKGKWTYAPNRFHQQVAVKGETRTINTYYNHYNYRTISEFINKTNRYTDLDSKILSLSYKPGVIEVILSFPLIFFKLFILRQGFRDGPIGFFVCWLYAFYYFVEKLKILEIQHKL